jgi:hypothetical protein
MSALPHGSDAAKWTQGFACILWVHVPLGAQLAHFAKFAFLGEFACFPKKLGKVSEDCVTVTRGWRVCTSGIICQRTGSLVRWHTCLAREIETCESYHRYECKATWAAGHAELVRCSTTQVS